MIELEIKSNARPFSHCFKKCVGSCHATTALRFDYREQLRRCRRELGFEYVRFHGLLDDDMSVVSYRPMTDEIVYGFHNIDCIFDFLIEIGMKPFIELSFMPQLLASGDKTIFHYNANATPPKDYGQWYDLIRRLTLHLIDRYGFEEVKTWFFEVWNEPNLGDFWAGTQQQYFDLYRYAAKAIKDCGPELKVGGPATARCEWVGDFVRFCRENNVPVDFVSTHHYPTDVALGHEYTIEDMVRNATKDAMVRTASVAKAEAEGLPLYFTEWNSSPSSADSLHDDPYAASFIIKTVGEMDGMVDMYSYWTFTDIFEEFCFQSTPFHGDFGMLNINGIPKPSYRAFELLNGLGDARLEVSGNCDDNNIEVLAAAGKDATKILLTNYNVPMRPIQTERVRVKADCLGGRTSVRARIIDDGSANPKALWRQMGEPDHLSKQQVAQLCAASEMRQVELPVRNGAVELDIDPYAVWCIIAE